LASGVPTYWQSQRQERPSLNFQLRIPRPGTARLHYGGGGGFDGLVRGIYEAGGIDNDNTGFNLAALNKGYINVSAMPDTRARSGLGGRGRVMGAAQPGGRRLFRDLSVPTVMSWPRDDQTATAVRDQVG